MANTLFLRFEGPMQSWGERARWSVRDTAPEPTKSGVVGLLGCALGLYADADLRALSGQLRVGVRCDHAGSTIVDYHTVGGGYKKPALLTAEGKPKKSRGKPHTEETWRSYVCDASFLVAVQASPELIARLAEAVQRPHWPVFLGRKSCPPSQPVFEGAGEYQSLEAALRAWPMVQTASQSGRVDVRAVVECSSDEGVRRRDEIDSRSHRTFLPRYAKEMILTVHTEATKE